MIEAGTSKPAPLDVVVAHSFSRLFRLLQTRVAGSGVNPVPTQGLKWRREWDSNPRWYCYHAGFQDRCLKPLGHLSALC